MKRLFNFLSKKEKVFIKPATETVEVRQYSQPGQMSAYMERAGIKHDETVEANIEGVRIGRTNQAGALTDVGDLTMFFCPMENVKVIKRLTPGDDKYIPRAVTLYGFNVASDFQVGTYNLNNVMLHANGSVNITATGKTTFELVND